MNIKTNKDIIIRVVKNFLWVTAVGAMILLICFMLFAESVVFSKEVIGLLIGIAILSLGIGGIVSAILIFFSFCTKKIAKLEKVIAEKDRIIATQSSMLRGTSVFATRHTTSKKQQPKASEKNSDKDIFKEIGSLSEEIPGEEPVTEETLIDELVSDEVSDQEETPSQESSDNEDV